MKKIIVTLTMALMLTLGAAGANAGIIPAWDYSLQGVFTSWTDSNGVSWNYGDGTNPTGLVASGEKTLNYDVFKGMPTPGSATGASQLAWGGKYVSIGVNSGTAITNGDAVQGLTINHGNLNGAPSTTPYVATAMLTMNVGPAGLGMGTTYATGMEVFYVSNGSWDIFVVDNPQAIAKETFTVDGFNYTFSFAESFTELFGPYADAVYAALGWDTNKKVYGMITNGDNVQHFDTYFKVTAQSVPVPEPATMMLLGAGLSGLGLLARKRRQG